MTKQKNKRSINRAVRKFRKMLMTDPYFQKRFDIQEVQMAFSTDCSIVYKRYAFIFKHPNGQVYKKETAWYNTYEITRNVLFKDYNGFIMDEVKWYILSEELIEQYKEAYKQLSK